MRILSCSLVFTGAFCTGLYLVHIPSCFPFGLRYCNTGHLHLSTSAFSQVSSVSPCLHSVRRNVHLSQSGTTAFVVRQALNFFRKKPTLLNLFLGELELVVNYFLLDYEDALDSCTGECGWYRLK